MNQSINPLSHVEDRAMPNEGGCSSSRGRSEGWSGISHKIFRCPVDFHSKFKCSQTESVEVIEDFTVSRIFIFNLFCVVLVNMIPFPRTATLKHLSHNDITVYV